MAIGRPGDGDSRADCGGAEAKPSAGEEAPERCAEANEDAVADSAEPNPPNPPKEAGAEGGNAGNGGGAFAQASLRRHFFVPRKLRLRATSEAETAETAETAVKDIDDPFWSSAVLSTSYIKKLGGLKPIPTIYDKKKE